jgi:hypothetical protein
VRISGRRAEGEEAGRKKLVVGTQVSPVADSSGPLVPPWRRVGAIFQAQAEGKTSDDIVEELLKVVGEPEPAKYVVAAKKKL